MMETSPVFSMVTVANGSVGVSVLIPLVILPAELLPVRASMLRNAGRLGGVWPVRGLSTLSDVSTGVAYLAVYASLLMGTSSSPLSSSPSPAALTVTNFSALFAKELGVSTKSVNFLMKETILGSAMHFHQKNRLYV